MADKYAGWADPQLSVLGACQALIVVQVQAVADAMGMNKRVRQYQIWLKQFINHGPDPRVRGAYDLGLQGDLSVEFTRGSKAHAAYTAGRMQRLRADPERGQEEAINVLMEELNG